MVLKRSEESLQRKQTSPTSALSRRGHGGKQRVLNVLPASGRKILREVGLTGCGFGSVVLVAPGPASQLRNSTLQCKLKSLIPTVCQRGFVVCFFLNPTVGHRSQVFSWLLLSCCQFRAGGVGKSVCLTHTSFKYMQGSIVSKMQELGTF